MGLYCEHFTTRRLKTSMSNPELFGAVSIQTTERLLCSFKMTWEALRYKESLKYFVRLNAIHFLYKAALR